MYRALTLVASLALIGASPADKAPPIDAGPAPTWEQAIALGESALKANLIDPSSAQIEWPYNFTAGTLKQLLSKRRTGYFTCGRVNSKNRMGGYSGQTWFLLMIRDGAVVSIDIGTTDEIDAANATCPGLVKNGVLTPAARATPAVAQTMASATTGADAAAAKGGLGISFVPTPYGAMLMAVSPGSAADRAGLKQGEVIEAVNGVPLKGLPADAMIKVVQGPTGTVAFTIIGVGEVKVSRPGQ